MEHNRVCSRADVANIHAKSQTFPFAQTEKENGNCTIYVGSFIALSIRCKDVDSEQVSIWGLLQDECKQRINRI